MTDLLPAQNVTGQSGNPTDELWRRNRFWLLLVLAVPILFFLLGQQIVPVSATNGREFGNPVLVVVSLISKNLFWMLYGCADLAYLSAIIYAAWFGNRFRWAWMLALIPISMLGLGRSHIDIFFGYHACLISASTAGIIGLASIPLISKKLDRHPSSPKPLAISDLLVLTTVVAFSIANSIYVANLDAVFFDEPFKLGAGMVAKFWIQAALNCWVATTLIYLCHCQRIRWPVVMLLTAMVARWALLVPFDFGDQGVAFDMSSFSTNLIRAYWLDILLEFLFLFLCIRVSRSRR